MGGGGTTSSVHSETPCQELQRLKDQDSNPHFVTKLYFLFDTEEHTVL